jgi:hypothetical protein
LWFGQEKQGLDHKMLWFLTEKRAKNGAKNAIFGPVFLALPRLT